MLYLRKAKTGLQTSIGSGKGHGESPSTNKLVLKAGRIETFEIFFFKNDNPRVAFLFFQLKNVCTDVFFFSKY